MDKVQEILALSKIECGDPECQRCLARRERRLEIIREGGMQGEVGGNYPLLTEMLEEMFFDNDMISGLGLREEEEWIWPAESGDLEALAGEFTENERTNLIQRWVGFSDDSPPDGNPLRVSYTWDDTERLVIRWQWENYEKVKPLLDFLNEVFDGRYYYNFFTG